MTWPAMCSPDGCLIECHLNPTRAQSILTRLNIMYYGTEAEIQLPLKRLPDSRVPFLILDGWCEEMHPATKNSLQHSQG